MNKLIVVSGGTKGIGKAILEKFAAANFDIFTCARNGDDLAVLKKEIEKKHSVALHYIVADLSERESVNKLSKAILALNQPVEVLVNNTGYFEPGLITEERDGALEKMMATNVYSAFHLTRALVGLMKENKRGHIFSMCSVASIVAYPNGGSYSISKFALLGFSKVLREELKEYGIRVTAVLAGATYTASWEKSGLQPERFMKAQDVADVVYGAYGLSGQCVVEELLIRPQLGDI